MASKTPELPARYHAGLRRERPGLMLREGDLNPCAAEICELVGATPDRKLVSRIPIGFLPENPMKSKWSLPTALH